MSLLDPLRVANVETPTGGAGVVLDLEGSLAREADVQGPLLALLRDT
ncbi:hypothetical protein [Salinibaculum rarum]|nr:hypothetical protein [Salinibaculum sp. KK48]